MAPVTHIRWMLNSDVQEVSEIESRCTRYPWPAVNFATCAQDKEIVCIVAEDDTNGNVLAGYIIYTYTKTRSRILNIGVDPFVQRRGVGRELLNKMLDKRPTTFAIIPESSLDALKFFKSLGFRNSVVKKNYFKDSMQDGIKMTYSKIPIAS